MSDVGGTAGLILGMSFATIVGLIDIFIQYAVRIILLPLEKTQTFIKSLDWDFQIFSKTGPVVGSKHRIPKNTPN